MRATKLAKALNGSSREARNLQASCGIHALMDKNIQVRPCRDVTFYDMSRTYSLPQPFIQISPEWVSGVRTLRDGGVGRGSERSRTQNRLSMRLDLF